MGVRLIASCICICQDDSMTFGILHPSVCFKCAKMAMQYRLIHVNVAAAMMERWTLFAALLALLYVCAAQDSQENLSSVNPLQVGQAQAKKHKHTCSKILLPVGLVYLNPLCRNSQEQGNIQPHSMQQDLADGEGSGVVLQVATGVASGVVNGLLHKGQTPPTTTTPTPAPYDAVRDGNQALPTTSSFNPYAPF